MLLQSNNDIISCYKLLLSIITSYEYIAVIDTL